MGCMMGFTPKSPHDWELFYTFGGCVPKSPLSCGKGEGFIKYKVMKLPDALNLWVNMSLSGKYYEEMYLKNCSCTGDAEISTGGQWKGPFGVVREFG